MKKYIIILFVSIAIQGAAQGQSITNKEQYINLGAGFGSSQTSISGAYIHNWNLGVKKKFFIGTGVRFTSYFGKDIDFLSAPANLANEENSTDTILSAKPQINALNALINLGYNFNNKLQAGFNIDAIGLGFGGNSTVSNGITSTNAKAANFNVLLVGNNDIGSLNSNFYLQYKLKSNLGFYAGYQYLFTELKSEIPLQIVPENNDRFRNKASMVYLGLTYHF